MAGDLELEKDFSEFIESLNAHDVRYLIVGGFAVGFHGRPRYTKDLDVWIDPAPDNAHRLVQALERFGFQSLGLKAHDFLDPHVVVQLGVPPVRIDLMTSASGVDFQDCYTTRIVAALDDVTASFIDLENLRKNKKATGRLQDLADLDNLK